MHKILHTILRDSQIHKVIHEFLKIYDFQDIQCSFVCFLVQGKRMETLANYMYYEIFRHDYLQFIL